MGRVILPRSSGDSGKILTLGCDLDAWYGCGGKIPVTTDISPKTNSHMLICGMSGSCKLHF